MPSVLLRPSRHGLRNRRKGKGTKNLVTTHLKIKVAVVPSDDDSQIMVISSWLGSHTKKYVVEGNTSGWRVQGSHDHILAYSTRKNSKATRTASRKAQNLLK